MLRRLTAIAALALTLASNVRGASADEGDAPTGKLLGAGVAMAVPTYWIGVVTHEGSHALAGKLMGAEVKQFSILPGRYGARKTFYFGYVRVSGLRTTRQRTLFWLAPKITDLILLGGYATLTLTDNLPENRYSALALTVLATGFAIDFGKDIISMKRGNDQVRIYNANGFKSELSRFPLRLTQAALTAAAGYALYRGYSHVFEDRSAAPAAAILPLWSGRL